MKKVLISIGLFCAIFMTTGHVYAAWTNNCDGNQCVVRNGDKAIFYEVGQNQLGIKKVEYKTISDRWDGQTQKAYLYLYEVLPAGIPTLRPWYHGNTDMMYRGVMKVHRFVDFMANALYPELPATDIRRYVATVESLGQHEQHLDELLRIFAWAECDISMFEFVLFTRQHKIKKIMIKTFPLQLAKYLELIDTTTPRKHKREYFKMVVRYMYGGDSNLRAKIFADFVRDTQKLVKWEDKYLNTPLMQIPCGQEQDVLVRRYCQYKQVTASHYVALKQSYDEIMVEKEKEEKKKISAWAVAKMAKAEAQGGILLDDLAYGDWSPDIAPEYVTALKNFAKENPGFIRVHQSNISYSHEQGITGFTGAKGTKAGKTYEVTGDKVTITYRQDYTIGEGIYRQTVANVEFIEILNIITNKRISLKGEAERDGETWRIAGATAEHRYVITDAAVLEKTKGLANKMKKPATVAGANVGMIAVVSYSSVTGRPVSIEVTSDAKASMSDENRTKMSK